ncbi:MAG: spore maturation protein CgeB [Halieaceae bacterium]|jgi:spore maturation protein CgeB
MTNDQDISMDTRGSRPSFFDSVSQDVFMTALLETMNQLWATRDYATALEKLLVQKGVVVAGELDALQWTAEEEAANERSREAFLKDAFRAVNADFTSIEKRNKLVDNFDESEPSV